MSEHGHHERGRDAAKVPTGRGGAGNMIRSPSRGRPAPEAGEVAAQKAYAEKHHTLLSGRGGAGNQRSPSRDPLDRARAREAEKHEKELRAAAIQHDEHNPHGTGRGGAGNVTREHSADARGRENGGVGAALRSLSRSRSRDARNSPRHTDATAEPSLASVDETASSHTESTQHDHKQGVFGKLASHLPGHHQK
ncbi:hypothetical protein BCV69DRAFT_309758 [Microstroma glucosiphilum]|uniref:Uncharacterized protein n=1 Tax=Pseudomicrostroma glucosiphilum TaxID=1684307 RepID=A0A316UG29_9BASI|nr:hypothetical protein BCV69DRAFT_309758 [Pseudomicrostroma glucosiphilum]PWN23898.1 hypothetical protein BCV69DRAFT_309758 [Pseudomicrostroma glucosiphilum]